MDDYSTQDDPRAVVEELGCNRVKFYQQPHNVGYISNFNTCLKRSKGKLVHLLHGDDCVREGFYACLQLAFEKQPSIGAAFSRNIAIDENGNWQWFSKLLRQESGILENWLEQISIINLLQPPSIVVRRDVYEQLGGFDSRISCCAEDWEMWVRIAAHFSVWYEVEPLALYRCHSSSLTGRCARTGQNMRDLRKIMEMNKAYFSTPTATEISRKAGNSWALYAIKHISPKMLATGDTTAAITQIQEALKCSQSWETLQESFFMFVKIGKFWIKQFVKTTLTS